MDTEEISRLVGDLKITKEAKQMAVTISKDEARAGRRKLERVIVGKIFARRMVNRETLRLNLPKILRARGGVEVEMVGNNVFMATFSMAADKRTALEEGPWHFFNDLMLLQETEMMQTLSEVEFNEMTIWIQCHNVPLACMEPNIIRRIGGRAGRVEEVDVGEGGLCVGKYARVRVTRRIEEPLVRCVPIAQEDSDKGGLVILKYEKLAHFCFACGRVGHIARDCSDPGVDKTAHSYDAWLRAGITKEMRHSKSEGVRHSIGVPNLVKRGEGSSDGGRDEEWRGERWAICVEGSSTEGGGRDEVERSSTQSLANLMETGKQREVEMDEGEGMGVHMVGVEGSKSEEEGGRDTPTEANRQLKEPRERGTTMHTRGGWKRRAREQSRGMRQKLKEVPASKKRGFETQPDEEERSRKKRDTTQWTEGVSSVEAMAVAAAQPRRSL